MTKTCPSCSPPDWATNASETKSWVCLQGQHLRWHWRLWGGAIWCVDAGPARSCYDNWRESAKMFVTSALEGVVLQIGD